MNEADRIRFEKEAELRRLLDLDDQRMADWELQNRDWLQEQRRGFRC
ncbi:hypothetical protein [Mesorhizobium sp. M1348]